MEQPFGAQLVAGDAWNFTVTPPTGFAPVDGFTLKCFFRGTQVLDLTATTVDSSTFQIAATKDQTKLLTAGSYAWQLRVYDANGAPTELNRGSVEILANLEAQIEGFDGRSWAKKGLDAVEANLLGLAGREDQQYQINGRMLSTMKRSELLDLRAYFKAEVRKEQRENGQLANDTSILVRFGRV